MKLTKTLSLYFSKKFFISLAVSLAISTLVVLLIDSAELARRISKVGEGDFLLASRLALLKLPEMLLEVLPFIILFGSLGTFFLLARSSELIIVRVSGLSIWQFLLPIITIVLALGFIIIFFIQPFIATSTERFKELEAKFIRGQENLITLSENGLWLKEEGENNNDYYIIHALGLGNQGNNLENVIFFHHDNQGRLLKRIDTDKAILDNGKWELSDVWIQKNKQPSSFSKSLLISTSLSPDQIQENFSPPETFSIWKLPKFISITENAGFSSLRHKTRLYILIAFPFFLASMVLAAAPFSINFLRTGKINYLLLGGLITGFVIYTFSNVVEAFGASGAINPILSAWLPPIIAILTGITALLFTEES